MLIYFYNQKIKKLNKIPRAGFEPKTQTNNNYSDLITKFHTTSLNMKHSVVWNFVKTRKATTLGSDDSIFEEEGQTSAAKHDWANGNLTCFSKPIVSRHNRPLSKGTHHMCQGDCQDNNQTPWFENNRHCDI